MRVVRIVAVVIGVLYVAGSSLGHAQTEPAGKITLKGAPNGDVTFDHKAHTKHPGTKCDTCHHASKPEKPNKTATQPCRDCHTKAATAPMKTKLQAAFHNPLSKAGTCPDCHVKEAAAGKKTVPTKCTDCHKKA